jgi:DNA polymerase-3 subunit epsilon
MRQIILDIESTGLSVYRDRIVQISLMYIDTSMQKQKTILINPTIPISEGAHRIHKISDSQVASKPTFDYYAKSIFDLINKCDVIITYNGTNFDLPILAFELLRCGYDLPQKVHIDIYSQISELERSKRLSDVYLRYVGEKMEGAHSADCDVIATWKIYEEILKKLS